MLMYVMDCYGILVTQLMNDELMIINVESVNELYIIYIYIVNILHVQHIQFTNISPRP